MMAGTFGALVTDRDGTYVLSNNHVLADENNLPVGSPIFQPGLLDGGSVSRDQIATLTRFVPIDPSGSNQVDCAIAQVLRADLVTREILHIGAPAGTADAAFDMNVHKFGRTTSYTVGRITSIDTDVTIQYDAGPVFFPGQITIASVAGARSSSPFSKAGDSGSLIVERASGKAVGLLFAGSAQRTIANHIGDVLQALAVQLA
jgi:S1-C subfamily serine protease